MWTNYQSFSTIDLYVDNLYCELDAVPRAPQFSSCSVNFDELFSRNVVLKHRQQLILSVI